MELFPFIGTKKLNEFIWPNPYNSAGIFDVTKGIDDRQIVGILGARFKYSEPQAAKLSNTTIGTLHNCEIQMVRIDPAFGTVTLANIIAGRPLFWTDKTKFLVSPLASAVAQLAGISPVVCTSANAKGDIIPIVVEGDVEILMSASITKTTVAVNDPVVLAIASNLGVADVLADATGWTNVQQSIYMGKMISNLGTGGDGAVAIVHLMNAIRVYRDGVE